ncbi:PcfJ domain-containing protein [Listeria monocytogenes]|uniref:PcfJ domain-containing protein n=1 Tax=Listeria monocytogenes TaxID=1639 RepID=UPI0009841AED|nr:PcfJ domain-containing protein [Listeria monocytogenes]EAC5777340.1 hypothetical protein [Listeria monocytogenes]EAG7018518.1 hypothetical protein [Listeria monocytogenes]NVQ51638.1 PcfJ domain-containing protein [Listeria monocytogenes]HAA9321095.1 hypothetical protein [Listeria monocytogenes]
MLLQNKNQIIKNNFNVEGDISERTFRRNIVKNVISTSNLKGYTIIQDELMLYDEGLEMQHCVYSYHDEIVNGDCLIYQYKNKRDRYTIEITIRNKKYFVAQVYGKCNSAPSRELIQKINLDIAKVKFSKRTKIYI